MEANPSIDLLLEQNEIQDRYLVFTIAGQSYGIDIGYIIEIIEVLPITSVPFLPDCMKGIINLRGTIIPLMDVRLRFGLPEEEYTERTCIVVLENGGQMIGLIVDAVQEVLDIPKELRMPPPEAQIGDTQRYINSVGNANGKIQLLLNCDMLMNI